MTNFTTDLKTSYKLDPLIKEFFPYFFFYFNILGVFFSLQSFHFRYSNITVWSITITSLCVIFRCLL